MIYWEGLIISLLYTVLVIGLVFQLKKVYSNPQLSFCKIKLTVLLSLLSVMCMLRWIESFSYESMTALKFIAAYTPGILMTIFVGFFLDYVLHSLNVKAIDRPDPIVPFLRTLCQIQYLF